MSIIMTRRRSELSILSELHQDSVAQDCKTHKRKRGALSILSELHHTVKCPLCSAMEDNFQFFLSCIACPDCHRRRCLRARRLSILSELHHMMKFYIYVEDAYFLSILSELHPQRRHKSNRINIPIFQFFLSCIKSRICLM